MTQTRSNQAASGECPWIFSVAGAQESLDDRSAMRNPLLSARCSRKLALTSRDDDPSPSLCSETERFHAVLIRSALLAVGFSEIAVASLSQLFKQAAVESHKDILIDHQALTHQMQ
jgi:hypothetical protein